jgi:hypothetical protein
MRATCLHLAAALGAALALAGCSAAREEGLVASASAPQDAAPAHEAEADAPAPAQPNAPDLLAQARALAAEKGLASVSAPEADALARAALAPPGAGAAGAQGGEQAGANDPRLAFRRAAQLYAQAGGAEPKSDARPDPNDPREIFRRAQEKAQALKAREARAFGPLLALEPAPAPAPLPPSSLWMAAVGAAAEPAFVQALRAPEAASAKID